MDEANSSAAQRLTIGVLAGVEAGVIGGALMLAVLIASAMWHGNVWWSVPNLLGSTFFGAAALRTGPGLATLSGSALELMSCGLAGALFGLLFVNMRDGRRAVLFGILAALGWFYVSRDIVWPRINPRVPLHTSTGPALVAHLVLGACLGRTPRFAAALRGPRNTVYPPDPSSPPEAAGAPGTSSTADSEPDGRL